MIKSIKLGSLKGLVVSSWISSVNASSCFLLLSRSFFNQVSLEASKEDDSGVEEI